MLLDMDAFFASAEQVARPELKGKPVIVGGQIGDRSVVASASYEARALGVKTAMPIAQAHRICPRGTFLRGSFALYSEFSRKVLEICRTFTPLVEQASIDEAYLDMTGTEQTYARTSERTGHSGLSTQHSKLSPQSSVLSPDSNWPVQAAENLLLEIRRQTGLSASIGVGSNKLIARVAMESAKPGGICFVWPGYEAAFLADKPLKAIPGIGPQTAAMLEDYNLRTAADVQRTSLELLIATFGDRLGQLLHDCAAGHGQTDVQPESAPQKSVGRDTSFERDTTDMNFIRAMLYYLTERACRTLRRMNRAACTVSVKLRYSDFVTVVKSRTLPEPNNHDDAIYKVAEELLTKLYTRQISIRLVGIHLSGLVSAGQIQMSLWDPGFLRQGRLYEASDLIRQRYGFCAVMKGPAIELMGRMEHDQAGLKLRTACLTK